MMAIKYVASKGAPFSNVVISKISYNNKKIYVGSNLKNYVTKCYIIIIITIIIIIIIWNSVRDNIWKKGPRSLLHTW